MSWKTLPDSVGYWFSEDGDELLVQKGSGYWVERLSLDFNRGATIEEALRVAGANPGRWIKAERPVFPELPDAPPRVLVTRRDAGDLRWCVLNQRGAFSSIDDQYPFCDLPKRLIVVPHPDNDQRAVEVIENAR